MRQRAELCPECWIFILLLKRSISLGILIKGGTVMARCARCARCAAIVRQRAELCPECWIFICGQALFPPQLTQLNTTLLTM